MAILKSKTLADGRTGNFWKIRGVYLSPDNSSVRAFADLYVDAATATSGVPIHSADILLSGENNPMNPSILVDLVEQELISMDGDFVSGTQI